MAVKYKDYYDILGVSKDADEDDIRRAYRKLARKYHPDLNNELDAEDRFKDIGEAYEVLKDPEKRQKYDQLGSNWDQGQDFTPPPGWDFHSNFDQRQQHSGAGFRDSGGETVFSDFFETLFGGHFGDSFQGPAGGEGSFTRPQAGADLTATLQITLEEAYRGTTRHMALTAESPFRDAQTAGQKSLEVKIPPGVLPGQKMRLAGQGSPSRSSGRKGDLYLTIEIEPHPRFRLDDRNLKTDIVLTPWEAALGAEVPLETLNGSVTLKIPEGTQSGQRFKLRGKGMQHPQKGPGDLFATAKIKVPKSLSQEERELFKQLSERSSFNPRG